MPPRVCKHFYHCRKILCLPGPERIQQGFGDSMKTAAANMFRRRSDRKMKLDAKKYDEMRKAASPPSPLLKDCLWAFFVGGAICLLGEGLRMLYAALGFTLTDAGTLTSATLIGLSAFTTAMGWYQKLAAKAGAGTLVPITGFANAVVAPAIEFRNEGLVSGVGAKMFIIAGPVIVYGMLASVVWGVIYHFIRPLMGG